MDVWKLDDKDGSGPPGWPVTLQPAYGGTEARPGGMVHTEAAAREILSLPMFPQITQVQQEYVVERLAAAVGGGAAA